MTPELQKELLLNSQPTRQELVQTILSIEKHFENIETLIPRQRQDMLFAYYTAQFQYHLITGKAFNHLANIPTQPAGVVDMLHPSG